MSLYALLGRIGSHAHFVFRADGAAYLPALLAAHLSAPHWGA